MSPATLSEFPRRAAVAASAFAGFSGLLLAIGTGHAATAIPSGVPSVQAVNQLPLQFEANRGQADSRCPRG